MFKRSLVIGGLLAGAFVLPAVVGAQVTGVCSNCHTMHNSQNGVNTVLPADASGPHANLLNGGGCVGCHAVDANLATGMDASGKPQVFSQSSGTGSTSLVLNAGYFTKTTGTVLGGVNTINTIQHNVTGITSQDTIHLLTTPGGVARAAQLDCQACHTKSGHHAAAVAGDYRMLSGTIRTDASAQVTGSPAHTDWGVSGGTGVAVGTRGEIAYQAGDMNNFCGGCHPNFHTNNGTGYNDVTQRNGAAYDGTWIRHPTDIQVTKDVTATNYTPSIHDDYTQATIQSVAADVIVLGSTLTAPPTRTVSGSDGTIMCLSCHLAHGGPYADLLSFDYSANQAGGTTRSIGCETCHSYGTNGM